MSEITALLQAAVDKYRSPDANGSNGAAGLSKLLGLSQGALSHKVSPTYEGRHCSPEEVIALCRLTGDVGPVAHMCIQLGGIFLPLNPPGAALPSGAMPAGIAPTVKEFGEFLSQAASDGSPASWSENRWATFDKEFTESVVSLVQLYSSIKAQRAAEVVR